MHLNLAMLLCGTGQADLLHSVLHMYLASKQAYVRACVCALMRDQASKYV